MIFFTFSLNFRFDIMNIFPEGEKMKTLIIVFVIIFLSMSCAEKNKSVSEIESFSDEDFYADNESEDDSAQHYGDIILRYDITIDENDWNAMLNDPLCQNGTEPCGSEYVKAGLTFNGKTFSSVGIRFKGNSSLTSVAALGSDDAGYQRYSFKIKMDKFIEDQLLDGIKTINLNNSFLDPSMMREVLSYDLFRSADVPASRTAYVSLYINGELYGFYISVQEVDKIFLKQWFTDNDGNLYKPEYGDLVYKGVSISDYGTDITDQSGKFHVEGIDNYVKKTNETENDYSDIIELMSVLQMEPDQNFVKELEKIFDVDRYLSFLAVHSLIVSLDSYSGGLPQNYYLYKDSVSGRFVYIPWDLNNSFGTFNCYKLTPEQVANLNIDSPYCIETPNANNNGAPIDASSRPLISKILSVNEYRTELRSKIDSMLNSIFTIDTISKRTDALTGLISDSVLNDPRAFFDYSAFLMNIEESVDKVPGIKEFTNIRIASVTSQLETPVVCGDKVCSPGENCSLDCSDSCKECEIYHDQAGQCVPSCKGECVCPSAPDGQPLVCDTATWICHP